MNFVKNLLESAKTMHRGILKGWTALCNTYFDAVATAYPDLIRANVQSLGEATLDLLESGETSDPRVNEPQYPRLTVDPFLDPSVRALYEVGAIRIHASGDPIVDPTPATLLRGMARLALPKTFLRGIVNATRERRGDPPLSEAQFEALDAELFDSLRRGFSRSIGERWFAALNKGAYYLHRSMALPCMILPGSQEFYEEGINFYRNQGADAEVFIYSTTSGLVIPREFRGDAKKNIIGTSTS